MSDRRRQWAAVLSDPEEGASLQGERGEEREK